MKQNRRKSMRALGCTILACTLTCTALPAYAADTQTAQAQEDTELLTEVPSTDMETAPGTEITEESMCTTASALAADILSGNYKNVAENYTYDLQMKPAVASGQIEQALKSYVDNSGVLMEQKTSYPGTVQGVYTNIEVPCAFANQSWNLSITFNAEGAIAGIHVGEYSEGPDEIPDGITETDLNLPIANDRTLPGTLTVPDDTDSYPAVVFVHGSGSSDRNETIGSLKPFQDLAWGLAKLGIASYRYDKISYVYGAELAADPDFTVYDETVNDAAAAIALLRTQPGVSSVYVIGHSQGGMMMGAIAEEGNPDGCIMMAAPAENFADTMERQILFLESLNDNPTEEETATYELYKTEIAKMKDLDALSPDETVLGQTQTYIHSLMDYDAVSEAAKITVPVLVLQGEEDYQVTTNDFQLWEDAYEEDDNWIFCSFPGLTHLFMKGSYEDGPNAYNGTGHVENDVTGTIADFIQSSAR